MVREIAVSELTENLAQMCIEANHVLSGDMDRALKCAVETEESPLGTKILKQLQENLQIADEERIPICQDTGMAVVFLEVGQDVHFVGGSVEDAVNEGVRKGYEEGYLRKSVVRDPIDRVNTKDNTPAVIHYSIVPGDQVKMTFAPKGFGSENMSRIFMLKPADGLEGVKEAILTAVRDRRAQRRIHDGRTLDTGQPEPPADQCPAADGRAGFGFQLLQAADRPAQEHPRGTKRAV